jgi:hypothetical protein
MVSFNTKVSRNTIAQSTRRDGSGMNFFPPFFALSKKVS